MAAKSRVGLAYLATVLLLGAVPSRAQEAPPPANESDTVGPRELENFNLPGTVTRPADTPPAPAPAPRRETPSPSPAVPPSRPPAASAQDPRPTPAERPATRQPVSDSAADRPAPPARTAGDARSAVTMQLPPLSDSPTSSPLGDPAIAPSSAPAPGGFPWAWLLAGLALIGGGLAYWKFGRARAATAGGPLIDEFAPPPPARAPAAAPNPASIPAAPIPAAPIPAAPIPAAPVPGADADPIGIVSTRLRPWVEVDLKPVRCVVEDDHIAIDVELTLFNSGSLPARQILLEAAMLNAGPNQDHDIEYFFSNPIGAGKRASSLQPLKKAVVRSRIVTPRKDAQEYEIEGRKVYIPLIAVNAIYNWPSGEGQTASAYIVGRETKSAKLAPFRLDRGQAAYEPVDKRQLPNGTRV